MPFSRASSPKISRPLTWLVRGTGVLMAFSFGLLLVWGLILMIIGGICEWSQHPHGYADIGFMMGIALFSIILWGGLAMVGYFMWQRVTSVTIANFAFVFALFSARTFYLSLPERLPQGINDMVWIGFQNTTNPTQSLYRECLTALAFFLFYKIIKIFLIKVLEPRDLCHRVGQ